MFFFKIVKPEKLCWEEDEGWSTAEMFVPSSK